MDTNTIKTIRGIWYACIAAVSLYAFPQSRTLLSAILDYQLGGIPIISILAIGSVLGLVLKMSNPYAI